jgi:hypothetical protein
MSEERGVCAAPGGARFGECHVIVLIGKEDTAGFLFTCHTLSYSIWGSKAASWLLSKCLVWQLASPNPEPGQNISVRLNFQLLAKDEKALNSFAPSSRNVSSLLLDSSPGKVGTSQAPSLHCYRRAHRICKILSSLVLAS